MANVSINNITETWTSSGTTYSGIKYNVTDTASAAGSKLIDLQVGGVSKFSVGKGGDISDSIFGNLSSGNIYLGSFGAGAPRIYGRWQTTSRNYIEFNAGSGFDMTLSTNGLGSLILTPGVALEQRNGTNAQSYRIYLSYTDATNNSRFAINATSNYYRLASEIGTSTGSKKPIVTDIYQSTVDPTTTDIPDGTSTVWKNTTSGVVKLWANNGGTLIGVALA